MVTRSDPALAPSGVGVDLGGARLVARGAGTLWWPAVGLLCVSDLHLGKSERLARRRGVLVPPYETQDTLQRLASELLICAPRIVVCLGDSFDDVTAADNLDANARMQIGAMMQGRDWVWVKGNHDAHQVGFDGVQTACFDIGPLRFRHIANASQQFEISGHYHPKAAVRTRAGSVSRPCFLRDSRRIILPAFGTYTGGLRSTSGVLSQIMHPDATAILTGTVPVAIPMPRARR